MCALNSQVICDKANEKTMESFQKRILVAQSFQAASFMVAPLGQSRPSRKWITIGALQGFNRGEVKRFFDVFCFRLWLFVDSRVLVL